MRKFKFRIFDRKNKKSYISSYPYPEDYGMDRENFIISQFTGLKDRYGKEIYEGDIVGINSGKSSVKLPVKFGRYSFSKFIGECGEISENIELYGFYVENEYLYIQMLKGNVVILESTND